MSAPASKQNIRQVIKARRHAMDPEWRAAQSARIRERIAAMPALAGATMVAAYLAMPGEVDLADMVSDLMGAGCTVCVPALDAARGVYAMAAISPTTRYADALYGLREPEDPTWVAPASIDCAVIPGVAFDAAGRRVGHGGGYYDRMLADMDALKIGVAFDFQIFDRVPAEGHDITMDWVITQTRACKPEGA